MQKVAAIVVLYNPENTVINNLNSYVYQVDKLYVIDNSDNVNNYLVKQIMSIKGVDYTWNKKNLGIAQALNLGARKAIEEEKPIMGICLGNQLLGLAAGGTTYKLKYGHRSHNQPVLLRDTNRCFITSQNHGFAIDDKTLPKEWEPLFVNVNDETNEGIRHKTKPFFSTQFHPEASSGPVDTEFLFDDFIENVRKYRSQLQINNLSAND